MHGMSAITVIETDQARRHRFGHPYDRAARQLPFAPFLQVGRDVAQKQSPVMLASYWGGALINFWVDKTKTPASEANAAPTKKVAVGAI